ncbi:hypothetical protein Taro_041514, partial [Colocasia esculenta]|nr:hypothetical protein [Colocasia esculenta]
SLNEDTPSSHQGNVEKVPEYCWLPLDAAGSGTLPSSYPAAGKGPQVSSAKLSSPRGLGVSRRTDGRAESRWGHLPNR